MHTIDPVTFDAYKRLLARPDPQDLPRRANVRRLEGDPDRRVTRFPEILMCWLQRHYLEVDIEEPPSRVTRSSKRRERPENPAGLRLLRRAG